MKRKKTPNTGHRTSNIEWCGLEFRVSEQPQAAYGDKARQKFDLEDRLLNFAVEIVDLTEALPNTRAANHVAGQLLRSGTSPYGNHGEGEAAESLNDFIHKLKVCLKELRETKRWLRLAARLRHEESLANVPCILREADELIQIFRASIKTGGKERMSNRILSFDVRCSVFGVSLFSHSALSVGRYAFPPSTFLDPRFSCIS